MRSATWSAKKSIYGLSAGRVQSVAVRMLVERELERMAFRSGRWWDLKATFTSADPAEPYFDATLVSVGGTKIAGGGDFDSATGRLANLDTHLLDEDAAAQLRDRLSSEQFVVSERTDTPRAKALVGHDSHDEGAQRLYEQGYITYMRTDSTNLAADAVEAIRATIAKKYGVENLPPQPRTYRTKTANAQEAHEAIRPAGTEMPTPESLREILDEDGLKLYELIWHERSHLKWPMPDPKTKLKLTCGTGTQNEAVFVARGGSPSSQGTCWPTLMMPKSRTRAGGVDPMVLWTTEATRPRGWGDADMQDIEARSHETKPPHRYTEASLIEALENGVSAGRVRTRASSRRSKSRRNTA